MDTPLDAGSNTGSDKLVPDKGVLVLMLVLDRLLDKVPVAHGIDGVVDGVVDGVAFHVRSACLRAMDGCTPRHTVGVSISFILLLLLLVLLLVVLVLLLLSTLPLQTIEESARVELVTPAVVVVVDDRATGNPSIARGLPAILLISSWLATLPPLPMKHRRS